MTKNNLKVVKSAKDKDLENKEKNKALELYFFLCFPNLCLLPIWPLLNYFLSFDASFLLIVNIRIILFKCTHFVLIGKN